MKIKLLSDIHLEFTPYHIPYDGEDILILAGDLSPTFRQVVTMIDMYLTICKHAQVIVVLGNHDYYGHTLAQTEIFWETYSRPNVHVLMETSVVINGVRFYGSILWTDMERGNLRTMGMCKRYLNDFQQIKDFSPAKFIALHYAHKRSMQEMLDHSQEPVVIVTHYLPSMKSILTKYKDSPMNPGFACTDMDELIHHPKVKLWCHGHTHSSLDYMDGNTRVVCNPRGYTYPDGRSENQAFNGHSTTDLDLISPVDPCSYSFQDLFDAAGLVLYPEEFYTLPQTLRNIEVKKMCAKTGWYWKDVEKDGMVYTSFSKNCEYN
jgi:predicted phosphohydrolase